VDKPVDNYIKPS